MKKKSFKKGFSTSRGLNRNQMIDEIVKFATMPVDGIRITDCQPGAKEHFTIFVNLMPDRLLSELYKARTSGDLKYLLIVSFGSQLLALADPELVGGSMYSGMLNDVFRAERCIKTEIGKIVCQNCIRAIITCSSKNK